jgi:hypothetical protein
LCSSGTQKLSIEKQQNMKKKKITGKKIEKTSQEKSSSFHVIAQLVTHREREE